MSSVSREPPELTQPRLQWLAPAPEEPVVSEYDLIVVGSGGGAMTGAAIAAKRGLSVLVLEKTAWLGGTSAYSGGACWLPGTQI
ncbi:MAG: FAD-binding protein, partial [Nocardioidaceae bacterium]|nr:FAD-binding protein [Nocardioidaceae bacterium]